MVAEHSADLHTVMTADGIYRFVSRSAADLFGWAADDLVGKHQDEFVHPDDIPPVDEAREATVDPAHGTITTVSRFRCADGTYRWTETVSTPTEGCDETLVVATVRDISARMAGELDLQRKATTDPLTGVANRVVFMDRLHQALRRLDRQDVLVAVLFLDLDEFKLINDAVGHLIGDQVLLQMAERLRDFLRPQDTLARWGGDEFAVVVEDLTWAEQAVALGERIAEAGRTPFQVGDEQFVCTTSVGIAVTPHANYSADQLLHEADQALYRAKEQGRDRAEVYDEDLRTRTVGRLSTERMLRRAIDEDRLRLEYQPIIDLRTGRTVSAEALIRVWEDDSGELVSAESFIEVAEQTGLLATMDDWVLGQVIAQAGLWHDLFAGLDFHDIAINLTARHLADSGFAQSVIDDLAVAGLPTGALQIEVTERVLMEASNSAMSGLEVLREAGVRVGLDDFGTGYSSLPYLRMFPLDFVKIDRSFIRDLVRDSTEESIVTSIIDLSHALGMEVVAEGIETPSQLEELVGLGCDRGQGFHFAASGPAAAIETRVMHRPSGFDPPPCGSGP